jgi:hypothetical protein
VAFLFVGGSGATPLVGGHDGLRLRAASSEARPDTIGETVRAVAGGDRPSGGGLHRVWLPIMRAAADDRMHDYAAPASVVGYAGGTVPETPCAVGTSVRTWRQNARYCAQDRTILYDESWLQELAQTFGPFAPAAVLAHEWGHHVQVFADPVPPGVRAELQADCFAGMYLGEIEVFEPDGTYTMRLDELRTALTWFFQHGDRDYRESQWFQPGVHGSQQQRVLAFTTGYIAKSLDLGTIRRLVNGLDWCLGYADFEPDRFSDIGPYRLLGLPGRPGTWTEDVLEIPTRLSPALASSQIRLRWIPSSEPIEAATQAGLAERMRTWLPGARMTPLGALAIRTGTGVAGEFETPEEAGVAALAVPDSGGGGLIIVASRPRSLVTPQDATGRLAAFLEQAIAIDQVVNRLCSPGESADPADERHNAVCMTDAQ